MGIPVNHFLCPIAHAIIRKSGEHLRQADDSQ
jgi:hypothetical protein